MDRMTIDKMAMNNADDTQLARSTLDAYQGNHWLLLLFAPDETDAAYQEQQKLLEGDAATTEEHDLMIARLFADGESNFAGTQTVTGLPRELRLLFGIAEDEFAVLLLDKNGSLKFHHRTVTPPAEIFNVIDRAAEQ